MHPVSLGRPRSFEALSFSLFSSHPSFSFTLSVLLFLAAANSSRELLNLPVPVMLGAFLEASNVQKAPADKSGGLRLSRVLAAHVCVLEWSGCPFKSWHYLTLISGLVKQSERLSLVLRLCPQPNDWQ